MEEIEVRDIAQFKHKEWDLRVDEVQSGTLFQTCQWLEICRDVLPRDLRICVYSFYHLEVSSNGW